MKIGIIGAGYVGLVTGVCLASKGNTVICYDIDSAKVRALKKGRVPFYEPDVAHLLSSALKKGKLFFVHTLNGCLLSSKIAFVCVGTPPRENGSADMSYFHKAIFGIADVGKNVKDSEFIVVNKSTVPVG
ncbi:MAG: UDP-glucose/GDP-mannose dehydrogenase family protein, partial [Candidatus Jacksonbacteria bacterium]|nr:UDP-glucose/GDP-mannose dehydrogenase family protein [Candidatus Jacksonbacteria bacterium]